MNADYFYGEYKAALDFLGVGFHGMSDVQVYIKDGKFIMLSDDKEVSIILPKEPTL